MILIYEPLDGPVERLDIDELSAVESEEVERVTGLDWDEVETELKAQKPQALRAVLWAFRKRDDAALRFSGFDVPGWRRRLRARLTAEETAEHVRDVVRQLPDEDSPDRVRLLHLLRTVADDPSDVDAALRSLAPKAAGRGKAASARSASDIGGTSRTS